MTAKERLNATLNHQTPDKIVIDFGATPVTGIHVRVIEALRNHYGLSKKPIKLVEPYQMLGEVDNELMEVLGVDIIGLSPQNNMFGFPNENWKEFKTFWNQEILVPEKFNTKINEKGDLLIFPEGDMNAMPSAVMPSSGFFFDTIIRQQPIDDEKLNPEDNLEEFKLMNDDDLVYWKKQIDSIKGTTKGIIANFGGSGLGDIALVPGPFLKNPKGIRDITEWYLSTVMRTDYIHEVFEKQTNILIKNYKKLFVIVGNSIDVAYICGTDFGTQDSTFCSGDAYSELYMPYYKKINNWIHKNTTWKTFKHSCGAVESFMELFIESGFDIINPVQINAKGMDSNLLKEKYGKHLTFWGGGVDTQKVLSFGTPEDVAKQVKEQCEILGRNGGFVFNTIHNIQANTPMPNVVALFNTINKIRN